MCAAGNGRRGGSRPGVPLEHAGPEAGRITRSRGETGLAGYSPAAAGHAAAVDQRLSSQVRRAAGPSKPW